MPEITEYKGNKLITLNPGSKYPFSFGLNKAKMIMENLDSIKIFIETNGESCGEQKQENNGEATTPF